MQSMCCKCSLNIFFSEICKNKSCKHLRLAISDISSSWYTPRQLIVYIVLYISISDICSSWYTPGQLIVYIVLYISISDICSSSYTPGQLIVYIVLYISISDMCSSWYTPGQLIVYIVFYRMCNIRLIQYCCTSDIDRFLPCVSTIASTDQSQLSSVTYCAIQTLYSMHWDAIKRINLN